MRLPVLPDSKTRVEWDDSAYKDVVFRRHITVSDDLLVDIITVDNPYSQIVDTTYLVDAQFLSALKKEEYLKVLHPNVLAAKEIIPEPAAKFAFQGFTLYCYSPGASTLYPGRGPNNPSTSDIEYLIMRSREQRVNHIVVTDLSGENDIKLKVEKKTLTVRVNDELTQLYPLLS
ncbi:hypothetical protein FHW74_000276 [Atlantibacter sp. RC6]|nr:hypothetical protein [Atlantibacter sp. RC6]MBB3320845.1 hypothetical protein [Atlantibacter sp. RC6]